MTCAIVFTYSLDLNPEFQPVLHKKISLVLTYERPRRVAFVKEEKASTMRSSVFKFIFVTLIFSFVIFHHLEFLDQDSIQNFQGRVLFWV